MKAFILAAGLGTRLRPWTLSHPKALVEIGGKSILHHLMDKLCLDPSISQIFINVHHFSEQIISYVSSHSSAWRIPVSISDESACLLDTGGGLLKALELMNVATDEPVLVHNVDIVTNVSFSQMLSHHISSGARVTMLCSDRSSSRRLYFEPTTHQLLGWENATTGQQIPVHPEGHSLSQGVPLAFGGVHIVSSAVLEDLKRYSLAKGRPDFPLIPFYLHLAHSQAICSYTPPSGTQWWDVGRPETLQLAQQWYDQHIAPVPNQP